MSFWSFKVDDWIEEQKTDEHCQKIIEEMKRLNKFKHISKGNKCKILPHGILAIKDGPNIVSKLKINEILEINHDQKLLGHLGIAKKLSRLQYKFTCYDHFTIYDA